VGIRRGRRSWPRGVEWSDGDEHVHAHEDGHAGRSWPRHSRLEGETWRSPMREGSKPGGWMTATGSSLVDTMSSSLQRGIRVGGGRRVVAWDGERGEWRLECPGQGRRWGWRRWYGPWCSCLWGTLARGAISDSKEEALSAK
jgi:hypothetical protein